MNQNKAWISQYENELGTRESVSGYGSELANTLEVREALPYIIKHYNISSIVDMPCGDWDWMKEVELGGTEYLGLDIVPAMIQANIYRYGSETISFKVHDAVNEVAPIADLVICRDLLFHLPETQVQAVLANLRCSYLLTTTFPEAANVDVIADTCIRWRQINICAEPYNLPQPIYTIQENNSEACQNRIMGLFQLTN